jgi:Domain of unknown function (DUF4335)
MTTVRRQYSLPNCSLILNGLGEFTPPASTNVRPLMSTLVNAECYLVGQEQTINGGLEFLKQLVSTVSNYTQRLLSSFTHPNLVEDGGLVRLEKGTLEHQHRLISKSEGVTTVWDLSTVQLFDLAEAIDQLLADSMTLPDLVVALRPTPKGRSKKSGGQAAPIGLGLSGLAASALAFYFLPAPKNVNPVINQPKAISVPISPSPLVPPQPFSTPLNQPVIPPRSLQSQPIPPRSIPAQPKGK